MVKTARPPGAPTPNGLAGQPPRSPGLNPRPSGTRCYIEHRTRGFKPIVVAATFRASARGKEECDMADRMMVWLLLVTVVKAVLEVAAAMLRVATR